MRAGVPAAAALTALIGLSPDPAASLKTMAAGLSGASGSSAMPLLLAAIGGGIAAWAAPRIGHGTIGWIRHLPADTGAHGRALLGALVAAQTPVALAWGGLFAIAWASGAPVEYARLCALPAVTTGIAIACLPSRRGFALGIAGLVAVALAIVGGWIGIALSFVCSFAGLRLYAPKRASSLSSSSRVSPIHARLIPAAIASRAVGWRSAAALAPAGLALAAAWLFARNNTEINPAGPLRFAAGAATALALASLAEPLASRRPPWRWARSLPWSAADRVLSDGAWFAAHALVVPSACALLLNFEVALAALSIVPLLAIRAARTLRRRKPIAGTAAVVLGEGLFVAVLLGVSEWTAIVALALFWPAWREAARCDRELDVSRWSPGGPLAIGDPGSSRGG